MNALKIICTLFPALSLSLLSLNLSPVLPISNVSSSRVFHSCVRPGSCLCFKIEASLWQNPYGSWEISNHLLSNLLNFWQPHMLPHFFFCRGRRACLLKLTPVFKATSYGGPSSVESFAIFGGFQQTETVLLLWQTSDIPRWCIFSTETGCGCCI